MFTGLNTEYEKFHVDSFRKCPTSELSPHKKSQPKIIYTCENIKIHKLYSYKYARLNENRH